MKTLDLIANQDSSSNLTTAPVPLGDSINYSFQAIFTGSDVAGSVKIQVSNFDDPDTFVDLTGATDSVASSAPAKINVTGSGDRYARLVWTYTSGTGNISVRYVGKETLGKTSKL